MSTAGKVLIVLILLTSVGWIVLAAGVSQLNANGNKRLNDLAEQVAKLQTDVKQAQDDVVAMRGDTTSIQAKLDRDVTVLRSRQADLEKARSQIRESLSRNEYQLEIAQETITRAKTALEHRTEELAADSQTLEKSRSEVKDLMAKTHDLLTQLQTLREEFQTKYRGNVQSLGRAR